jgi:hypothetical protein
MHRVTEESIHRECEWKRSAKGETADALSATQEPPRRLDKQCLLMEVRQECPMNKPFVLYWLRRSSPWEYDA